MRTRYRRKHFALHPHLNEPFQSHLPVIFQLAALGHTQRQADLQDKKRRASQRRNESVSRLDAS